MICRDSKINMLLNYLIYFGPNHEMWVMLQVKSVSLIELIMHSFRASAV